MADRSRWWLGAPLLGLVLVAAYLVSLVRLEAFMESPYVPAVELIAILVLGTALTYGGWQLRVEQFDAASQRRAIGFALVGSFAAAFIGGIVISHEEPTAGVHIPLSEALQGIIIGMAFGADAGLYVGLVGERARRANQSVADQRDAFAFLNRLLRHHVLNSINVIDGNAEILADHVDEESRDRLETIRRRSNHIATLVGDVRAIGETLSGTVEAKPIALRPLVTREVEKARETFPEATFTVESMDDAAVEATETLAAVFEHLLANAVVHNDSEDPHVWVDVERADTTVRVTVSDNGSGVEATPDLFRPIGEGNEGFGLYLVKALVTAYGGEISVGESEAGGAAFTVEFPVAGHRT